MPATIVFLNDLPTIIDGPGEYVTRDGGRATIREVKYLPDHKPENTAFAAKGSLWKQFRGKYTPRGHDIWHVSGRGFPLNEAGTDIVGKFDGAGDQ